MFGDDYANLHLDALFGSNHHGDVPSTVYITLYYDPPDDTGGGTEADYAGFVRIAITNDDTSFPPAADRVKELAIEIAFATPASNVGPFRAWAIHGHATDDDLIVGEEFATPITGQAGRAVTIEAGSIVIEHFSIGA